MADRRVRYVLEVDYEGESVVLRAQDDLREVDSAAREAAAGVDETGFGFTRLQASVVTAQAALGVAQQGLAAVQQAAQFAWETLSEGAALADAQADFEDLSASVGKAAGLMEGEMVAAAGGLKTSAQLVAEASDLMSLGLGLSGDEIVRLTGLAAELDWNMGTLADTLNTGSTRGLKEFGLSIDDVKEKMAVLEEQGVATDEAFRLAIMEAGEERLDRVGRKSEESSGQLQILQVAVEGAQDAFAQSAVEAFADSLERVAGGAAGASAELTGIGSGLGMMAGTAGGWVMENQRRIMGVFEQGWMANLVDWTMAIGVQMGLQRRAVQEAGTDVGAWIGVEAALAPLVEQTTEATWERVEAEIALRNALADKGREAAAGKVIPIADLETGNYLYSELSVRFEDFAVRQEAAANAAEAWGDYLVDAGQRGNAAWQWATGGQVAGFELPEMEPLVTPERDVSVTTRVSGPNEDDAARLEEYTELAERAAGRIDDLEHGIGTYGMTQEEVNKALEKAYGELSHYQALMGTIPPVVEEVSSVHQGMAINQEALNRMIYDQAIAMGIGAGAASDLAQQMGLMSPAQAAATEAATQYNIIAENLAGAARDGRLDWEDYAGAVEHAIEVLNGAQLVELPKRERVDKADMESPEDYFEAGGYRDYEPIVLEVDTTLVEAAVGEAKGMIDGFVSPEEVYQAVLDIDSEGAVTKVEQITELINGVPEEKTIVFNFRATGMEILEELRAMGALP